MLQLLLIMAIRFDLFTKTQTKTHPHNVTIETSARVIEKYAKLFTVPRKEHYTSIHALSPYDFYRSGNECKYEIVELGERRWILNTPREASQLLPFLPINQEEWEQFLRMEHEKLVNLAKELRECTTDSILKTSENMFLLQAVIIPQPLQELQ